MIYALKLFIPHYDDRFFSCKFVFASRRELGYKEAMNNFGNLIRVFIGGASFIEWMDYASNQAPVKP